MLIALANDGKLDESKTYTGPEDFYQEAMGHSFTHYVYDNNATYDDDGTETAQWLRFLVRATGMIPA